VNWQFLPDWKATVGLRYFHYRFTFSQMATGLAAETGLFTGAASDSGVTPKFTLTYTPDKDLLIYGTASKGFRPGGPNLPIPTSGFIDCTSAFRQLGLKGEPPTYQPDTVWNYEIGEKGRLLDGRLEVNSSLYYIDWNQIQQQTTLSCGYYFTANSGKAFSEGGELEVTARITPKLTIVQSAGYTRAVLTNQTLPGNSLLGQQLPDIPKWTLSTSLQYSQELTDDMTLTGLLANRFVGSELDFSALPAAYTRKPQYDIVDARIGVNTDTWSAQLYVDNLFDRTAVLGINRFETQNNPWLSRLFVSRPRTVGVTVETKF